MSTRNAVKETPLGNSSLRFKEAIYFVVILNEWNNDPSPAAANDNVQ